ncbi:MAG: hypothetical protein ACK5N8_07375 [Alphaproteobacteria bacterium]
MKNKLISYEVSECYVVFVGDVNLWWLKPLKKGFRHCYIVVELDDGMTWLEINPLSNRLFVIAHQFVKPCDYITLLKKEKSVIILKEKMKDVGGNVAPLGIFSCVEFVKRSLGIHSFWTITPYQLYNKLKIVGKKS